VVRIHRAVPLHTGSGSHRASSLDRDPGDLELGRVTMWFAVADRTRVWNGTHLTVFEFQVTKEWDIDFDAAAASI
jgi:hypothetical protein